jgi:large subunit ribosomal protein L3
MLQGLLGKKKGMTQIFNQEGEAVPVTVVQVGPCTVLQVKEKTGKGGRTSVQVGFEANPRKNQTQAVKGLFKKLSEKAGKAVEIQRHLKDFLVAEEGKVPGVGDVIDVTLFEEGGKIKVSGTSKGKGYQGVMKRHGFGGGPRYHGSCFHRRPGSIGCRAFPGRVHKGKRMGGHTGDHRVTVQGLTVVRVDKEQNLLYIRGAVPGANEGIVEVIKA